VSLSPETLSVILSACSALSLAIRSGVEDISGRMNQVSEGVKNMETHLSSKPGESDREKVFLIWCRAEKGRDLILVLSIGIR